jgi:coproporphyrinogen III oxidase-like Fe-S oxidoreductase
MEPRFLDEFFAEHPLPPEVDGEAIRREWLALQPPYRIDERHLPLPLWARRPFEETGLQAWETLCRNVTQTDPGQAICIYVHIPFCPEHCEFCDCYSFRLGTHQQQHIHGYLERLERETDLWASLGGLADRPVSTIHFGGGTPTFLDGPSFTRLSGLLRSHYGTGSQTEWALESTVAELTPEMLECLENLEFNRLHVGVQSLQDPVRQRLNRRTTANDVLGAIDAAVLRGWVVSVDLIYGLPGQTLDGLLQDIRSLIASGVAGFSLYELQVSSSNRRFVRRYNLDQRDRRHNFLLGQVAAHLLGALGYRKTLFNHFAVARDTNLYFTFPEREEDCLALGTIADGVFGDYHYRHLEYAAYLQSIGRQHPGLEGGMRRSQAENRWHPLAVALMAGKVESSLLANAESMELARRWQRALLLEGDTDDSSLNLTGSGSWFVGNMLTELAELAMVPRG